MAVTIERNDGYKREDMADTKKIDPQKLKKHFHTKDLTVTNER